VASPAKSAAPDLAGLIWKPPFAQSGLAMASRLRFTLSAATAALRVLRPVAMPRAPVSPWQSRTHLMAPVACRSFGSQVSRCPPLCHAFHHKRWVYSIFFQGSDRWAFRCMPCLQTFLDEKEVIDRVLSVVKNFEKVRLPNLPLTKHTPDREIKSSVSASSVRQVEPAKVSAKARFKEDLSLDSLDIVEVVMAIEEEFALEIPDNEADKILTVDDAVKYIASHPQAK
jgi:acyl carrier protein